MATKRASGRAQKTANRVRTGSNKPSGHTSRAAKGAPGRHTAVVGSAAKKKADVMGRARDTAHRTSDLKRKGMKDVTDEVQRRYDAQDDDVPTPPSSLNFDRTASAARTGHNRIADRRRKHTAVNPEISGGDVDADWMGGYFVGEEAATGDNPTPGQSEVEDIGKAVGLDYEDTEELKSTPKVERRDRHRWELDPASSEDYKDRVGERKRGRRP